jgi:hypothetical protein
MSWQCPACDAELDPSRERPVGVWGPFPVGEITCQACGVDNIGVIHGPGAYGAVTRALERPENADA